MIIVIIKDPSRPPHNFFKKPDKKNTYFCNFKNLSFYFHFLTEKNNLKKSKI